MYLLLLNIIKLFCAENPNPTIGNPGSKNYISEEETPNQKPGNSTLQTVQNNDSLNDTHDFNFDINLFDAILSEEYTFSLESETQSNLCVNRLEFDDKSYRIVKGIYKLNYGFDKISFTKFKSRFWFLYLYRLVIKDLENMKIKEISRDVVNSYWSGEDDKDSKGFKIFAETNFLEDNYYLLKVISTLYNIKCVFFPDMVKTEDLEFFDLHYKKQNILQKSKNFSDDEFNEQMETYKSIIDRMNLILKSIILKDSKVIFRTNIRIFSEINELINNVDKELLNNHNSIVIEFNGLSSTETNFNFEKKVKLYVKNILNHGCLILKKKFLKKMNNEVQTNSESHNSLQLSKDKIFERELFIPSFIFRFFKDKKSSETAFKLFTKEFQKYISELNLKDQTNFGHERIMNTLECFHTLEFIKKKFLQNKMFELYYYCELKETELRKDALYALIYVLAWPIYKDL